MVKNESRVEKTDLTCACNARKSMRFERLLL
jgi:hypothetical protein